MLSKLLLLTTLTTLTTATPLLTRQTPDTNTNVTLTQYLSSTNCSPSTNIITTISLNQCLDTGSQENFGSILFNDLQTSSDSVGNCYGQVYEYAGCGTYPGDGTGFWRQEVMEGGDVCFGSLEWADGQAALGSVMLVCG